MSREPLLLGTYGTIRTYRRDSGWRAKTLYRDFDGITRPVEARGRTEAVARRRLVAALRDRQRPSSSTLITPETRVSALAEAWWSEVERSSLSPGTRRNYRDRLDRQVIPSLGNLRVRELTPGVIDRHLRDVKDRHGAGTAKLCRTVLSGMAKFAVRHDALGGNPVRDVSVSTSGEPTKRPRALTLAQAAQLRASLTYDDKAIARDLPDLVAMMLATGLRIGEVCAITWDRVDLDLGTVQAGGVVVRVRGEGLRIKLDPTTKATPRVLRLPSWAVAMLRLRVTGNSEAVTGNSSPVFPAPLGGLRDPSNTQADLRDAFAAAGFDWVTSHVLRKTVATLMDGAGLSVRAAADQLGHARPSMTSDVYYGRGMADTGAAGVLEALG